MVGAPHCNLGQALGQAGFDLANRVGNTYVLAMLLAEAGSEPQLYQYLGVLFLALVAVAFAVGTMFASKLAGWFFNTRRAKALGRHTRTKDTPYECGMNAVGEGSSRMSVKFYLIAMLFILFDIEVVFLYTWAVAYKDMLGDEATVNLIFGTMISFLGILFVGYIYAIRKNAFDWKS